MVEKFSRDYQIRTYECDKNGDLRLVTLMNIFQDMADSHATIMGLGLDFCLKIGMAWVGSNYHLRIKKLPSLHEQITVITWPAVEKKLGAIRDFQVFDRQGEAIITASSQWILIDAIKKRPLGLREHLPQYSVAQGRSMPELFELKLPEAERTDYRCEFNVRFDDIDINNHVNNAVYPLWASEAVSKDFRLAHTPEIVEIAFKKECHLGEKVEVITQVEDSCSLHSIRALGDGRELSRIRIIWR